MDDPFDDPFDSSDFEFDTAPKKKMSGDRPDAASIAKLESAQEDYITTKQTVKQLKSAWTRAIQALWVLRFNALRELTLRQSVAQPFCGDDLVRFFNAIIGKINPEAKNKPAPDRSLIHLGLLRERIGENCGPYISQVNDGSSRQDLGNRLKELTKMVITDIGCKGTNGNDVDTKGFRPDWTVELWTEKSKTLQSPKFSFGNLCVAGKKKQRNLRSKRVRSDGSTNNSRKKGETSRKSPSASGQHLIGSGLNENAGSASDKDPNKNVGSGSGLLNDNAGTGFNLFGQTCRRGAPRRPW
ncbi:hypothetical protein MMC22_004000 [Lobaria immixta]|nr:hypothetical protein [Lobaria immixta]